jgi:hypothetical protein
MVKRLLAGVVFSGIRAFSVGRETGGEDALGNGPVFEK